MVNAPADCHWQHAPWPIVLSPNPTFGGVGPAIVRVGIITILQGSSNTVNAGIGEPAADAHPARSAMRVHPVAIGADGERKWRVRDDQRDRHGH